METDKIETLIEFAKSSLNVNISKDVVDSDVYHCHVLDETRSKGFGSSDDPKLALVKAVAEYIERQALQAKARELSLQTSSGFAAHWHRAEAMNKARQELVERDGFLCSWFGTRSPYWLSDQEMRHFNLTDLIEKKKLFELKGLTFDFGIVGVSGKDFILVGMLTPICGKNFGFAIDTAAGHDVRDLARKIYKTLCYMASFLLKRVASGGKWYDQSLRHISTIEDHFEYFLSPGNSPKWFFGKSAVIAEIPPIAVQSQIIYECPRTQLTVAHATSETCQPYFVGEVAKDKINFERLKVVLPDLQDVLLSNHPLA